MGEKHIVYMTVSAQPIWLRYYYFSRLFLGRGGVDIHGLGCTPVSINMWPTRMAGNLLILLQLVFFLYSLSCMGCNGVGEKTGKKEYQKKNFDMPLQWYYEISRHRSHIYGDGCTWSSSSGVLLLDIWSLSHFPPIWFLVVLKTSTSGFGVAEVTSLIDWFSDANSET
jgi:hypothetical protein